ncbi:hypothetical protein [Desulfolucanica intricata]|nr:hypothetical protein [Desulfolucanica intricata]
MANQETLEVIHKNLYDQVMDGDFSEENMAELARLEREMGA